MLLTFFCERVKNILAILKLKKKKKIENRRRGEKGKRRGKGSFTLGGLLGASSGTVSNNFTISGLEGSNASDIRCGVSAAEDKSLFLSSTLGGLLFAGSIFFADEFETVDFLTTTGSA